MSAALSVGSLLFSRPVPSNYLLLQLWSAGILHVAFRNLCKSQSWGRVIVGHQREDQRTFFSQNMIILVKLLFCVNVVTWIVKFSFWACRSRSSYMLLFWQNHCLMNLTTFSLTYMAHTDTGWARTVIKNAGQFDWNFHIGFLYHFLMYTKQPVRIEYLSRPWYK